MKRGTPRHKKMYDLAARLKIELPHAVGIMEMLWQHAAQYTRQGDIGTLDDQDIAAAVKWSKRPEALIEGLVGSGWLHRHDEYRLYVHDWPDHCEQSVEKWLKSQKPPKDFLPVYGKTLDRVVTISRKGTPSGTAKAEAKAEAKNLNEGGFLACGFADAEQFEGWWERVVENHPNRNLNSQAKNLLWPLIQTGQFDRQEFELGYTALRESRGDDWTKNGGSFCTNLYQIIDNKLWKYKPVEDSSDGFTPAMRAALQMEN